MLNYYTTYSAIETTFLKEAPRDKEITFYDSVSGKPLFIAPRGRTFAEFEKESRSHGWPSFRDEEVVWENVRCLENGEAVSLVGTHLGALNFDLHISSSLTPTNHSLRSIHLLIFQMLMLTLIVFIRPQSS